MKVVIEKIFPLQSSPEIAWGCLQQIEGVAGCMPGAQITEQVDATHYKGTVKVKVGPATMAFKGDIEVVSIDPATRTLHLIGKGSDSTGTSGASMDLIATVQAADGGCELVGKSEVSMSGKAAAFGGRMMQTVSDQILKQFAGNFDALVGHVQAQQPATPSGSPAANESGVSSAAPAAPAPAPMPASELNGLALAWAVVKDWIRGLFSRKTA